MTPTQKIAVLVPYAIVAILLILSIGLLAVASIPYSTLKPQLEALTLHGHAAVYTDGFHQRVVTILRGASTVPLVAAVVIFLCRRRVARLADYVIESLSSFLAKVSMEAVSALRKESRLHQLLLAATVLLGLCVRLLFLFQPMRYDEAYTFTHFASTPLYLALSNYSSTNNHLLNTLLMHFSYMLFGNYPWALRLPTLIAGWLLVPATYLVTRTFFSKHAALLAAALVASSSPLILFSTNARGYMLMALFFLLLLVLAPYCLRSSNPAPWILFSIITALGFYALPTMLYGFGIAAGWILLMALRREVGASRLAVVRRLVMASTGGAAVTILLYSPVLLVWGTTMRNQDVLPQSWEKMASLLPVSALAAWRQWNLALPGPVSILVAVGFAAALVFHSRLSRHSVPLAGVALLWIVPVVLAQRVVPYERVWLFLLPLYFALASAGLAFVWSVAVPALVRYRMEAFGLIGLATGAMLAWNVAVTQSVYYADDTGTLRDGESITAWMKDHLRTGDVVLAVTPADGPLEYYFPVFGLRPAEYWYSAQIRGTQVDPGRRVLAVVRNAGPELSRMLETAGLAPSSLSNPELVQRFQEAAIYQIVAKDPRN